MTRVLYSCPACGLTRRPVEVRDPRPGEPLKSYVAACLAVVCPDHARASLCCESNKVDIALPLDKLGYQGGAG